MSRASIATPCPAPYALSSLPIPVAGRRLSRTSLGSTQDDTAEIDYTRAIQVEFQKARPRRKFTFQRKDKKQAGVTIFEDVLENEELVVETKPHLGGSTLLGKRAQKLPGRALAKDRDVETDMQQPLQGIGESRRTLSARQSAVGGNEQEMGILVQEDLYGVTEEQHIRRGLKKEPRRRTIFVPDDTTVLSIHPGANQTDRLNDTFQLQDLATKPSAIREVSQPILDFIAPQPAKRARMSLAAAPKRVPLEHVAVQVPNVPTTDIPGQNGGKENMPPGAKAVERSGYNNKPAGRVLSIEKAFPARSSLFQPTAASQARQTNVPRNAVPLSKTSNNTHRRQSTAIGRDASAPAAIKSNQHSILHPPEAKYLECLNLDPALEDRPKVSRPRPKLVERRVERLQQYPVLSEDIAQPQLYEDNWLSHQEVALSELVNQLFRRAEPRQEQWHKPKKCLRETLIDVYHQSSVATLHKRLQASLLYGALSRPRDAPRPANPAQDIGLRKRFLSLWLESYDQQSLHAAAEVVFGHQLPLPETTDGNSLDPHRGRRTLIAFLETFLVEVEDAEVPDEERGDDPNGRWRKMILRSLMLIWLLDHAKTLQLMDNCLFKPTSARKSSISMLYALAGMLIPSIGDITRVLRHLDYEVSHVQDPLDEVRYRIDNIAVDLRDGVLLARIVELLLFTPKKAQAEDALVDATVTVQLPDLTVLESALYNTEGMRCSRVVSQHLKMPCIARVQKVFNVEVGLSALNTHGRLGNDVINVTADDIVDGHREKTLSLLWLLVSTHGLEQLVDFRELAADIRRTTTIANDIETLPQDFSRLSQMQQESLLKKWASAYCARGGVRVSNLTTSFADGKAYAAILAAFVDYMDIPSTKRSSSPKTGSQDLANQLHALGCSTAFSKQLTSACVSSSKATLSNLAFLASRLLPLARRHNAAMVIQRVFRLGRSRNMVSQRISLMRLAHSCATVVQTRNRLLFAALVLQRSWRSVLDTRIKRLNVNVKQFQAIARTWLTARAVRRTRSDRVSYSQSLRVMGGW